MPTFGYLDPATGTLIITAIVGGLAAAGLWIRRSWYKAKSVFTGSQTADRQIAITADSSVDEAEA